MLAIAIGGGLGAVLRHLLSGIVTRAAGTGFPWGILTVNVTGGLLMGLLTGWFALRFGPDPTLRAFLTVGMLGGFTTFSTFSLEVMLMIERDQTGLALLYALLSVLLAVGALALGLRLARLFA